MDQHARGLHQHGAQLHQHRHDTSSPIDRTNMQTKVNAWQSALQALANKVAEIALKAALGQRYRHGQARRWRNRATTIAANGPAASFTRSGDLVTYVGSAYIVTTPHTSSSRRRRRRTPISRCSRRVRTPSWSLSPMRASSFASTRAERQPASQTLSFTATLKNTTDTTATWTAQKFNSSNASLGTFHAGWFGQHPHPD
jgi:hypothetical protein